MRKGLTLSDSCSSCCPVPGLISGAGFKALYGFGPAYLRDSLLLSSLPPLVTRPAYLGLSGMLLFREGGGKE